MASSLLKPPRAVRFAKCDAAWLLLPLGGRELRVLLALSLYADWRPQGNGRCYPKRDTLALSTGLAVSHVSVAVTALAKAGLITIVRLGRKNIYYVRQMGAENPMPPSDPKAFFEYLRDSGISIFRTATGPFQYAPNSRKFDEVDPLLRAIFSDYANGLPESKLQTLLDITQQSTSERIV